MYLVQDKGGAIALMLAALVFLGTWPAIMNFLEQRGRKLQHTYLDYSITNLLVAIVFALTFGQFGHSDDGQPNFLTQLGQVRMYSSSIGLRFSSVHSTHYSRRISPLTSAVCLSVGQLL